MLRVLSLVSRLKDRFDLRLITFVRETGERRFKQNAALLALREVFSQIHCVPKESTDLPRSAAPDLPEICREWYSPQMAARLAEAAQDADIVHIEFFQMAFYSWYVRDRPVVFTEHDTSHLSLRRSYFREWTGWSRLLKVREWLRVLRHHREVCSSFERIVTLTRADEARLRRIVPAGKLVHVPTGVDLGRFAFHPRRGGSDGERSARSPLLDGSRRGGAEIVFVGHYPHYPNEDAALWFCGEVLPILRQRRPEVRVLLVGSQPTERVRALAGPDVEVTGTVPDVRPYLERAAVFVAPLRLGFGVKGKVLEAFSAGAPVVATSTVAEGFPEAREGEHWLRADAPADFAREILRLIDDPELSARLARSARALVEDSYGWDPCAERLAGLYESLALRGKEAVVDA
jgi:glycosyltransferase involved in cell wall biosynthesis